MFQLRTSAFSYCVAFLLIVSHLVCSQGFEDANDNGVDKAFCSTLRARPKVQLPYRNAVCTMINDEAEYIREWIEYHYMIKFDHFYIYNDGSFDNIEEVLQPYIDKGIVSLYYWNQNRTVDSSLVEPTPEFTLNQRYCIADCLLRHQQETEWIGVWDVDEFLYINEEYSDFQDFVDRYVKDSTDYVQIPMATFGPSDHEFKPDGLVIENYQWRSKYISFGANKALGKFLGKSMYRAGCASVGVHMKASGPLPEHCKEKQEYIDFAVTPNYPAHFKHYYSKSREEYSMKVMKWGWELEEELFNKIVENHHDVLDKQMEKYVPYVKKAVQCNLLE